MMIRYFYYVVFMNMLMSVVLFVPKILLDHRFEGSVVSIVLALPIGGLMMILFIKAMAKFPQQGLPEILSPLPLWLKNSLLILTGFLWFSAGMITLMAFTDLATRFMNPDMEEWFILLIFVLAVSIVCQFQSDKLLYMIEISLFLNVPLIGLIVFSGIRSPYMDWHLILDAGTHIGLPGISSLAAATYTFTGYLNFIIFNRVFPKTLHTKWVWVVLIIVFTSLVTTYFFPIGYHGMNGVADYVFPWIVTADSIRMEFGPIERMLFVFLLLYLSLSIVSAVIHWHVGNELIRGVFQNNKEKAWVSWSILAFFSLSVIFLQMQITEIDLFILAEIWLILRLFFEISLVLLLFILSRRVKE